MKKPVVMIQVKGQEPLAAVPALFSNFLALSRVATEVQFEFIFLDLNLVANLLQAGKADETGVLPPVQGRTVAKIVMPAAAFVQLKDHISRLFHDIEAELKKSEETQDVRNRASS